MQLGVVEKLASLATLKSESDAWEDVVVLGKEATEEFNS